MACASCAPGDRAAFLEEEEPLGCDGGSCDRPEAASRPESTEDDRLACLSDAKAAEYDDPLIGQLQAFASDTFTPELTKPIEGEATVRCLAETGNAMACTESQGGSFELLGGAPGEGPIVFWPKGDASFYPTVINKVSRSNLTLESVPLFARVDIDPIFDQLGITPDPAKGHVLFEVVFADTERSRLASLELIAPSGRVAYRDGAEWTTALDRTTGDGLVMILNADAGRDLGIRMNVSYRYHDSGDELQTWEDIQVVRGAITYTPVQPMGAAPGGF